MKTYGSIPHGGTLIERVLRGDERDVEVERVKSFPRIPLDPVAISDLELIAIGAYSPLAGFMTRMDYIHVVSGMRLANGLVWPIPVTLPVSTDVIASLREGQEVTLVENGGHILAVMKIEDIFTRDKTHEAQEVYRTEDEKHPGVARLYQQSNILIGGPITLLNWPEQRDFVQFRFTPSQTRHMFERRSWRQIVGFQTRNPIHRSHDYLLRTALEIMGGLLLHPLVGETKPDDIPADVRMASYQVLLKNYYPPDRVILGVFPAAMRYAGPREAVFHALCRKNYGCTHFIVGRDHAGVGKFYGTYDAQRIFDEFQPDELGIIPLCFENTFFCTKCNGMASSRTCPHSEEDHVIFSGTEVRRRLEQGEELPLEFTRPEVSNLLAEAMRQKQGFTLWFTGLSGSGKSTIADLVVEELRARGMGVEVLDGDVVRTHLSKGLGFSKEDRDTNILRIGWVCQMLAGHNIVAIAAAISPYREARDEVRAMHEPGQFVEIYIDCPLEVLEARDVKGLYARARSGEITSFTGISDPYEPPENPEIVCKTAEETPEESANRILDYLRAKGWIKRQ